MTPRQKIEIRLSEVRQRLNAIAGLEGDAFTDEIRNEATALHTEFADLETRHRSAIMAEGETEARAAGLFGNQDGEAGERGRLLREANLADYLTPASAGSGIEGRARELNAALELPDVGKSGGVAVPWAMLECPEHRMVVPAGGTEHRAFTSTSANDGPEMQRPILQRLFGPGVMDALGVRMDSVPVGRTEWPLITGGVAPAQAKEEAAAAAAVTAAFSFASLKPKRLTGQYEYSHEIAASVSDIEQGLRRDLADAVKSSMSNLLINGAAPTNSNPQNVQGFLTKLTGADLAAAEAVYADYGSMHAAAVDGIHAGTETEVSSVIGDETYRHAAAVYQTGSGESGSEALRRRSRMCVASTYIPAIASMKQSAILHAGGPNGGGIMRGDSVAALWPTFEIIRDIYSKASQGVVLTWVSLWDAEVAFRAAAYKQVDVQVA